VNVVTQDHLLQISALLDSREFASAGQLLSAVNASELRTSSSLDRSTFHFLYGRFLFFQGEYAKALARVKCAIRLSRRGSDHALFAREKHLLGMIYDHLGRIEEAAEEYLESFASHKRAGNNSYIFRPLLSLGLAHLYRGDLTQARQVFFSALSYATKYNSASDVRRCRFNVCLASLLSGDLDRFRCSLDEIRTEPLGVIESAQWSRYKGQLAVLLLDTDTAREQLRNVMIVYAREHIQRDYVVCLEYLGMNEFLAGNYAKAKEYYQQVLAMPEPTASAVAQTLRMLTDVYVAERDWINAKETAAKAEQAITKINERIELAALWRAQAQIAERDRNHDVARDFFQKSIDLLQQCGARYELALTHFAVGQSTVHSSASRSEHLQQAKTLFVEMDVPKRVSQVEKAMVALSEDVVAKRRPTASYGIIEVPTIIGQSEQITDLLSRARKFGETDSNILITGETGTGKDLLAQYVHAMSQRGSGPFVVVNSATIPESLLEAELFGACKGSYSGAEKDRVGLIAEADGGSFFFDEISETPLFLQAKLLRVIETKVVRRVGENRDHCYDVRFIAATNCDLSERVRAGLFREDLFYRLRRGHLQVPTLRERKDDLPLLVHHFLSKRHLGSYTLEQVALLVEATGCDRYDWPGNVRELEGVIDDAAAMCSSKLVMDLAPILRDILIRLSKNDPENPERAEMIAALGRSGGNLSAAARELGIPEATLRYRLKKQPQ
jgi:transcriptional regulator with PAS, ATPase and Fis domain